MQVTVKGKTYNLKGLTDPEFNRAKKLCQDPPSSQCPTCGGKEEDRDGYKTFVSKRYRNSDGEMIDCDCHSQMALRLRYVLANIGDLYMRLDWDDFGVEDIKSTVDGYIDNWDDFSHHGFGLEFGGEQGLGKTFCATYIGKELIKKNKSVYFVPFQDMVFSWDREDAELMDITFRKVDLLIIDELAVSHSFGKSSIFADHFEALIRHRTNNNLPTILTTNVPEETLEDKYPRVYSLLAANQRRIEFTGRDYRRTKKGDEKLEKILNKEKDPIT